jgi:meiotic recombination protein REC8
VSSIITCQRALLKATRYGVSRVYLQQCGYVLSDAQNAHNAMRMMLRTVKNLALDPEAGKAR